jgi:ankyrin repeat protein
MGASHWKEAIPIKRRTLLLSSILLITPCMSCGVWLYIQQQDYARNQQLIGALTHGDTVQAIALLNAGADPNTRLAPLPTPSLKLLLDQLLHRTPAPVNFSPTALIFACGVSWYPRMSRSARLITLEENLPLLKVMLAHRANLHARALGNLSALHSAVIRQRVQTVELLLQHGADVNAQDDMGQTPLMLAASNGDVNTASLLLLHGANQNAQSIRGETALHYAVRSSAAEGLLHAMLARGANPNLRARSGNTPLQYARNVGRSDLVDLLRTGTK